MESVRSMNENLATAIPPDGTYPPDGTSFFESWLENPGNPKILKILIQTHYGIS